MARKDGGNMFGVLCCLNFFLLGEGVVGFFCCCFVLGFVCLFVLGFFALLCRGFLLLF